MLMKAGILKNVLYLQKPSKVTKQKPDKEKKIKNQNAQRASKLGIQYIAK